MSGEGGRGRGGGEGGRGRGVRGGEGGEGAHQVRRRPVTMQEALKTGAGKIKVFIMLESIFHCYFATVE